MRRNNWQTCRTVARAGVITLLLIGCDSVEPVEPENPEEPNQPVEQLRLEARSETTLTGTVGTLIDSVPVVQLTTLDGSPAPGREVRFLVSGGGSIAIASRRTDTAGMASPGAWTLGTMVKPQTVRARAEGVADLVFTAMAKPGPPATIIIVAGNHQTAAVGAPLPSPLQVKLADRYGNPVPEEPVSYTAILGNGTLLGESMMTDSLGIARSGVWTLGDVGAQLVRASAAGKTALFDAFACGNPCRGQELVFTRDGSLYSLVHGVETLLADGAAEPAWSPDGRRIAYAVYESDVFGDEATVDLYLMDADGSNAALRAENFYLPSWSPDGRQLAVTSLSGGIYTLSVEPDGTAPELLAEAASNPAWSPDGTKIAFAAYENFSFSLGIMNSDGSAVTAILTSDYYAFGNPTWSPDGRRLAFDRCDDFVCNLFAVDADGTNLVQLSTVDNAGAPAWSPDGSRIAFTSGGVIVWIPAYAPIDQPIPMAYGNSPAWRP